MKRYQLYNREILLKRAIEHVSIERDKLNRNEIEKFIRYLSNTNISQLRIVKYAYFLVKLSSWLGKPFSFAQKSDIEIIIDRINKGDYSEKTKEDYKAMIKRFYKWLLGNEENYPEQVKWIKAKSRNNSNVLPENLLVPREVSQLADSTEDIMQKAFVTSL